MANQLAAGRDGKPMSQSAPASAAKNASVSESIPTIQDLHNSSAIPQDVFRLHDLPQELQDRIFEFANPRIPNLRRMFERDCKFLRFSTLVNFWLVSRRYFVASAKAWFTAQVFDDISSKCMLKHSSGLFYQFAINVILNETFHRQSQTSKNLSKCMSLRQVKIYVDDQIIWLLYWYDAPVLDDYFGYHLDDSMLEWILEMRSIGGFRGLH